MITVRSVLAAIHFDYQPGRSRDEVADEGSDRHLSVEARSGKLSG
jgi:hypothetical protein